MLKYKIPQIVTLIPGFYIDPRAVRKKNKISDLDKEHKKSFINQ